MSIRNGDRARANKQAGKRRVRRQQIQLLKRILSPSLAGDGHIEVARAVAPKVED